MDASILKEAGLTSGEIKVYLALLELGSSTIGPIVEKSRVSRSIIYLILEKLIEKGIVSFITKEKTRYYQADSPEKIIKYVKERQERLNDTASKIHDLIPTLKLMMSSSKETDVKVFEGFEGTITVHERLYELLKKGDEFYYMGVANQPDYFHPYWKKDHVKRVKRGINCRILFNNEVPIEVLENRNSYALCQVGYMPKGINPPAWFFGYKNVVSITIPSAKPITIEITKQEIADSFKAYFEQIWKMSKILPKYK